MNNRIMNPLLVFTILFISLCCGQKTISIDRNIDANYPDPPPFTKKAETARYIAHYTDWAVVGTISTIATISGRPFTNMISLCDGPLDNSTGTPYFYIFDGDASMRDITQNPLVSITMSEAMLTYCRTKDFDPEDPRCGRLTLAGKMVNVTGSERTFAVNSLYQRHPAMKEWAKVHDFFPLKLEIDTVWMIDFFGAANFIPVKEYYAVDL